MTTITSLLAAIALLFAVAAAQANEAVQQAQVFLARYVETYHAFDPAVADLYSDDAVVQNTRTYPTGEVRKLLIPAPQYKALLRQTLSLAKQRGDRSQYTEPKFSQEGSAVRIHLNRYSELKKHTSPMVLLVGPDKAGQWVVLEELTESIP